MQGIVISSLILVVLSAEASVWNSNKNVSLIVVGRGGSGISSTVKEIIGRSKTISNSTGSKSSIQEFQVPIPGLEGSFLNIADVDGLVDGNTLENDASIISSLRSYLLKPSGLNGTLPDFFLIVSNFDDDFLQGENPVFPAVLKRIQILHEDLYNTTTPNTIFLLTKFMAVTKSNQRRPTKKLDEFRGVIRNFSHFPDPISLVVGENLWDEYELNYTTGYVRLLNREFYPKNLFDQFISTAVRLENNQSAIAIQLLRDTRITPGLIHSEFFDGEYSVGLNDFEADVLQKLYGEVAFTRNTEIEIGIMNAYDSLKVGSKAKAVSGLIELKRDFQSRNITKINQLPKPVFKKLRFFQDLEVGVNSQKSLLLKMAFHLSIPDFVVNPTVGCGYDVIQDRSLKTTPFLNMGNPNEYRIPDFLTCTRFPEPVQSDFGHLSESFEDYISLRNKFLGFADGKIPFLNQDKEVTIKPGFNLRPKPTEVNVSLSAVREVRTMECKINNSFQFNKEFRDSINALEPFNITTTDSHKLWSDFFGKYGTHIVIGGFAGGYIQSTLTSQGLLGILNSTAALNETLYDVLNFRNISVPQTPTYEIVGGDWKSRFENVSQIDPFVRDLLVQNWRQSLNNDPVMLHYELRLTPIAHYAKQVDQNLGLEVEKVAELLLSGNFTFSQIDTEVYNSSQLEDLEIPVVPAVSMALRREHRDYIANTIGQGYHMLKDIVLPSIPFRLSVLSNQIREVHQKHICTLVHAKTFKNMQAYLEHRLTEAFGVTTVPRNVVQNFKGRVFPGSIIEDRLDGNQIDVELRVYKEGINVVHGEADISTDFKTSLEALPLFSKYSRLNCDGRKKWKEFFDKFGTHYVKSTYYGHSYTFPHNTAELRRWTGFSDKCEIATATTAWYTPICDLAENLITTRLADSGWCRSSSFMGTKIFKLRSSYEFVSYRDLMENILGVDWYVCINEAMYQLMDNGLSC